MALVKCPDCEKMVSSRATVCPNCGCPSEFFENHMDEKRIENNQEEYQDDVKEDIPEEKIVFTLWDYEIAYPKGSENYAELFGNYLSAADKAYETMMNLYQHASGVSKALEILPKQAADLIFTVVNEGTKMLYKFGINMTPDQFVSKYSDKYPIDYGYYYNKIVEEYAEIMETKKELAAYRASEQANRGRWQGGGFGVKGAIKGAMTASVMNLGTDFLYSFGDSAKEKKDNAIIQKKLAALYRDKKTSDYLCYSVKTCIMNAYNAICEELNKINAFENKISISRKNAETIYAATLKYETDIEKKKEKMIDCIILYPGEKKYYEVFKDEILYGDSQFEEFLKFWKLEYLLSDLFKARKDKERFEAYFEERGIGEFDYANYADSNAAILLKYLYEYNQENDHLKKLRDIFPQYSNMAKMIENYFVEYINTSPDKKDILEWISPDISLREFLNCVEIIESLLDVKTMRDFRNSPHPTEKIEELLERDGDKIVLYSDISITENGTKGIAVTRKYVMDLKTRYKMEIKKISNIAVMSEGKEKWGVVLFDGTNNIKYMHGAVSEEELAAYYLKNILITMFVRYSGNFLLWNPNMSVQNPLEKEKQMENKPLGYTMVSEMNDGDKDKYCKYIKQYFMKYQDALSLENANTFRRRFKMIRGESDSVDLYDYCLNDETILNHIGEEKLGQYILYFKNGIVVTDQNLYVEKRRYPISELYEVLPYSTMYENPKSGKEYVLNIRTKAGSEAIKLNRESFSDIVYSTIFKTLNVALEGIRPRNITIHYEKKGKMSSWLCCGKCWSLDVTEKLIGQKCNNCGNTKFQTMYEPNIDDVNYQRLSINYPNLSEEKIKVLLYDENLHLQWISDMQDIVGAEQSEKVVRKNDAKDIIQEDTSNIQGREEKDIDEYIVKKFGVSSKVSAIKEYRKLTGVGLKEATDIVNKLLIKEEQKIVHNKKMFCTICGKQIDRNAKFCNYCGSKTEMPKK